MKKLNLLIIMAIIFAASCTHKNLEDLHPIKSNCDTLAISFKTNIQPIFDNNCGANNGGCHSVARYSGNQKFNDWAGINAAIQAGLILPQIRHDSGVNPMPQGGNKLDDCTIATIAKWKRDGALNN